MRTKTKTKAGWLSRGHHDSAELDVSEEAFGATGCFVAGTRLRLADGSAQSIETLQPGSAVLARADGSAARVVLGTRGPEPRPVVFLRTEVGHELGVTELHPMVVVRGGSTVTVIPAKELRAGDALLVLGASDKLESARITTIERKCHDGLVYNVEIEGKRTRESHFLVANNVVTGDLHLQREIERNERGAHETTVRIAMAA